MEHFETAAYAHARLRESIEDSLLELSGRLEQRSQIEENTSWADVAELRRLDILAVFRVRVQVHGEASFVLWGMPYITLKP